MNTRITTIKKSTMKGAVQTAFGSPGEVLGVTEVARPAVADDGVLVRVHAASIHIGAVYGVRGLPKLMRPMFKQFIADSGVIGQNMAGTVEAVGPDVTQLAVGDEVFGSSKGAFAEYAATTPEAVALKPANLSFEQASAIGVSAFTALQGLRTHGGLQEGQHVLVTGASGVSAPSRSRSPRQWEPRSPACAAPGTSTAREAPLSRAQPECGTGRHLVRRRRLLLDRRGAM